MLQDRLDLRLERRQIDELKWRLKLNHSTRFVNVLDVGAERVRQGSRDSPFEHGYLLTLEVPLFDSGAARVKKAEALYARAVDRFTQAAIDARSDLYDLAFVLFALGWYFRATGERHVIGIADELMSFIESEMTHPLGGFMEDTLGAMPRRQNPHMHLLEACLALYETTGEARFSAAARDLLDLFARRLFDGPAYCAN